MSTKKIKVLFQKEQKIFDIDLQENNTYESFIKKLNEEFDRKTTYQLMATNSSEQYTILNADNYLKILNEDIPEGLVLFMSEIVKAPEGIESNAEPKKEEKGETMEEEDDDDFIIEENAQANEEKNKNNDNLNINIEQEKNNEKKEQDQIYENIENNENNSQNIIKEEEKKNEENSRSNNPMSRSAIIRSSNNSPIYENPHNFEKTNTISFEKEEDINLKRSKYILTSPLIKQEMFKSENCCICNSPLKGVKYVCCICDNTILCEECELYHIHPCFKYKMHFISNIIETSNFIEKCYAFKLPFESRGYSKLFRKEYDLKISPLSDLSFSIRPSKKINIPIKILNYSKENINSSQFVIICKNQKNIFLSPNENEKYTIPAGGEHILQIKCIAPEKSCKKETIFIGIFSNELNIKSSRRLMHEYNIEVNFDTDDDKLNLELKNDDYIFCFNKEHKKLAQKVMKLTNNEYKVSNVLSCLFDNNWDHTKATKALKKKK